MTHASATAPAAERGEALRPPRWALLGVLFGALSAAAIALFGPIGVSGTYPRFVGSVLRQTAPEYAAARSEMAKRIGLASLGGSIRYRHGELNIDFRHGAEHPIAVATYDGRRMTAPLWEPSVQ